MINKRGSLRNFITRRISAYYKEIEQTLHYGTLFFASTKVIGTYST